MFPTMNDMMTWLRAAIPLLTLAVGGCPALTGCKAWIQTPPIETFAAKFIDEAVVPAVKEGIKQGVQAMNIQAGAQGINPAYVVTFEGYWQTGINGKVTIGVEGIAGQIMIATSTQHQSGEAVHPSEVVTEPKPAAAPLK